MLLRKKCVNKALENSPFKKIIYPITRGIKLPDFIWKVISDT